MAAVSGGHSPGAAGGLALTAFKAVTSLRPGDRARRLRQRPPAGAVTERGTLAQLLAAGGWYAGRWQEQRQPDGLRNHVPSAIIHWRSGPLLPLNLRHDRRGYPCPQG